MMSQATATNRGMGTSWNPWRELRYRRHITLGLTDLPETTGGAVYVTWPGGDAVVLIDLRLDRTHRNAALAHELVHDEWGIDDHHSRSALWPPVRARDERRVDEEVARRLVPLDDLEQVVALAEADGVALEAWEVAEEFDVPIAVAERACGLLRDRRAS